MKYPKKIKEMSWSKLREAYVLVDPETKKSYTIDPIAFLVWLQCDGKTSVDEMTDVFSVNGNRDIVKAAIKGILEKLKSSDLIEWN